MLRAKSVRFDDVGEAGAQIRGRTSTAETSVKVVAYERMLGTYSSPGGPVGAWSHHECVHKQERSRHLRPSVESPV